MSDDTKDRLETIRVCTDTVVEKLIRCWVIEAVAHHMYSTTPELFWRVPHNTPLGPMLKSQADEQVVRLHAVVSGKSLCGTCRAAGNKQKACPDVRCGKPLADGISLRGLDDLKNHRDVLGHPLTFQLDRPAARQFVEDKRDLYDLRPAVVWDVHRSIVEAQVAAGVISATVLEITFGPDQTNVLDSILRLCLKPGIGTMPEADLADIMAAVWEQTRSDFEKFPDGRLPPKTDAQRQAIREKMKSDWLKSQR